MAEWLTRLLLYRYRNVMQAEGSSFDSGSGQYRQCPYILYQILTFFYSYVVTMAADSASTSTFNNHTTRFSLCPFDPHHPIYLSKHQVSIRPAAEWLTRLLFRDPLTHIGKQKVPRSIRGQVVIIGILLSHSYLPPFAV